MRDEVGQVTELIGSEGEDLAHLQLLTRLLQLARPCCDAEPVSSANDCIQSIEALADCPVSFGAFGPPAGIQAF